jgi:hypothetical protein
VVEFLAASARLATTPEKEASDMAQTKKKPPRHNLPVYQKRILEGMPQRNKSKVSHSQLKRTRRSRNQRMVGQPPPLKWSIFV